MATNFCSLKHFLLYSGDNYQPPTDRGPYILPPAVNHYATAAEHGNTKASNNNELPKSSLRKLKQLYLQILNEIGSTTEIPHGNRGCPLKLGSCRFYIRKLTFNKCSLIQNTGCYHLIKCTKYCFWVKNTNVFWCKINFGLKLANINGAAKNIWYRYAVIRII